MTPIRKLAFLSCGLFLFGLSPTHGERINHEGRILGPALAPATAVLFNTPEADTILASLQIFPVTNPWNEDISRLPSEKNSDAIINRIISDLGSSRRSLRAFQEMNFVLVPEPQPLVPITFVDYGDESDPSPYPLPGNLPIETWPSGTGALSLEEWQRDLGGLGGDRHAIVVQPQTGFLWEMWQARLVGENWQASNGAKFDLHSNALRPAGWTSGDAAGLPMFPALVRYDECQRGVVEHACRIVVARTRRAYIYPATHYASTIPAIETNVPAMGQRLRLKSSFPIPVTWTKEEKALLTALKKYGALVADNGNFFSISITPDSRWSAGAFSHLQSVGITNFEVVQATGPSEGPRSPGAPVTCAGPDFSARAGVAVPLRGHVAFQGALPAIHWKSYDGPGVVSFQDSAATNTTVVFAVPGTYTLLLSADDGVHALACDAVSVTVTRDFRAMIELSGQQINLSWVGGNPPYVVEAANSPTSHVWSVVYSGVEPNAPLPASGAGGFFRIRGQ